MRRADYTMLADALARLELNRRLKMRIVESIADELAACYTNFNRQRFVTAAMGVTND